MFHSVVRSPTALLLLLLLQVRRLLASDVWMLSMKVHQGVSGWEQTWRTKGSNKPLLPLFDWDHQQLLMHHEYCQQGLRLVEIVNRFANYSVP